MEIRTLCALAALVSGCVVNAEPPGCRDPGSVAFTVESVESDCGDFTPPDLENCLQTHGAFGRESCVVEAEYHCADGVRAVAVFSFCAGQSAFGFETYRRVSDGCRAERALFEAL